MIRREISTGAAVAAVFLTAGVLSSPDQAPLIDPPRPAEQAFPIEEHREPIEPPPGYTPRTQPFLSWQPEASSNPTLTWPPYGCDAGIWSVRYELEQVEATATRVRATSSREDAMTFDVPHGNGWDLDLYPVTPEHAWTVASDSQSPAFAVRRLDGGETTCMYEHHVGGEPVQTRATVTDDGVTVYVLSDDVWAAFELDNACALVGERIVDGALAAPAGARFGLEAAGRDGGVAYQFVGDRQLVLTSDAFADVTIEADGSIEGFQVKSTKSGILVMFWDQQTTHLRVFEHDGPLRWETSFAHEALRSPITHAALHDGFLSVRGPLDSHRQHKDLVRVFDTHHDEIIGGGPAHLLNPTPLVWRWPSRMNTNFPLTQGSIWSDDWTSCMGRLGWTHLDAPRCDGERVAHSTSRTDGHVVVEVTSELSGKSETCTAALEVDDEADLLTTLDGGVVGVFAETTEELLGWEVDFDCELRRETRLPADVR